jgi:uncharacterized alkaline shock family protein YloU
MRLARMAHEVAMRTRGVVRTDGGPGGLVVSVGDGERVEGVTCVAATDGGYEVSLRLVCALMPLEPIAEQVRTAICAKAVTAGIHVSSVNVQVADVAGPEVG